MCNIGYQSKMHLNLKCCEISFVDNLFLSDPIILIFCNDTNVLSVKFQNDLTTQMGFFYGQVFTRLEFKMSFGQVSYVAQPPYCLAQRQWNQLIRK